MVGRKAELILRLERAMGGDSAVDKENTQQDGNVAMNPVQHKLLCSQNLLTFDADETAMEM